jgi:lipid-binding SYLF domain-containing protein
MPLLDLVLSDNDDGVAGIVQKLPDRLIEASKAEQVIGCLARSLMIGGCSGSGVITIRRSSAGT